MTNPRSRAGDDSQQHKTFWYEVFTFDKKPWFALGFGAGYLVATIVAIIAAFVYFGEC